MAPTKETEAGAASYVLDAAKSRFQVRATATGLLSAFGHNPTIAIRGFTGEVLFRAQTPEQSSLRFALDPGSLAVTNDINEKDRRDMERAMKEEVLETARYPEIRFETSEVQATRLAESMYRMKLIGKLTLHGVEQDVQIPCTVTVGEDSLRANGEFSIRQTDYGIHLVSAVGGALKVKDELKFQFDIAAHRGAGSKPAATS